MIDSHRDNYLILWYFFSIFFSNFRFFYNDCKTYFFLHDFLKWEAKLLIKVSILTDNSLHNGTLKLLKQLSWFYEVYNKLRSWNDLHFSTKLQHHYFFPTMVDTLSEPKPRHLVMSNLHVFTAIMRVSKIFINFFWPH